MPDDSAWLAAARDPATPGRDAALADMADFVRRSLARGFGRQLSDADLQDLTQDTLLRVHDKLSGFRGDSRFSTWVASIAVNTALAEMRRRKHQHVSLEEAVDLGQQNVTAPLAPRGLQERQQDQVLREAIEKALTERQRTALLAELGGLPLAAVAQKLGSQRGAVYKLLHDARKRLRGYLEERGFDASDLSTEHLESRP